VSAPVEGKTGYATRNQDLRQEARWPRVEIAAIAVEEYGDRGDFPVGHIKKSVERFGTGRYRHEFKVHMRFPSYP
jgi:hypothetical protein